jgi:two-component sensor histidine kinase
VADRPTPAAGMTMPEPRIHWGLVIGVVLALTLLFGVQTYLNQENLTFGGALARQLIVWGAWVPLLPFIIAAARKWRRVGRLSPGIVITQAIIGLCIAMLSSSLAGVLRWAVGLSAYQQLSMVLASSVIGNIGSSILRYWMIAAAYHAIAYSHELRERDLRQARLEASLAQAKLEALQGKLHPHFLFNTLNSIGALIRDQPAAAEQMLGNLSDLLRASLNAEPSREVTLGRELELVRQYVSIQQMRFQDRLSVHVEAAPDALDAYVPHLILQPLVENAIRHGIAPRDAAGTVRIGASRSGDRLRLIVEDDGLGLAKDGRSQEGTGIGLGGTRARLQQLYAGRATFDLQPRVPTGAIATLDLPFHTSPIAADGAPA